MLSLLISVGCIYPANYAEQKINEAYDTILRADKVTAEMIPALCDYVIFSENDAKDGPIKDREKRIKEMDEVIKKDLE